MSGSFSGKLDGSRGDASSSCKARYASRSPPHPPLRGTFSRRRTGRRENGGSRLAKGSWPYLFYGESFQLSISKHAQSGLPIAVAQLQEQRSCLFDFLV